MEANRAEKAFSLALFLSLILIVMGFVGFAQPEQAPVNPAFERYLQAVQAGRKMPGVGPEGYSLGYIPSPVDLSHMAGAKVAPKDRLPSSYDLRTLSRVTPIRNQQGCGCCWTFATMGAFESALITEGKGTWDLSENNLKECHGFTWGHARVETLF